MSWGFEILAWSLLVIATVTDLLWGKVHNLLTFVFLGAGLIAHFIWGGTVALTEACLSVLVAFVLFFPLFWLRALAAGDAKLFMALAAWIPTGEFIAVAAISVVLGAGVGTYLMVRTRGLKNATKSVVDHTQVAVGEFSHSYRMPFAPAVLCAFAIARIGDLQHWGWW